MAEGNEKPNLISLAVCPFVQRSVIILLEKGIEYNVTYIDLDNRPTWFGEISPAGKVPVLVVRGRPIFESAVINEYLDEVYMPKIHPDDPLLRAFHRGWIEFSSGIIMAQYRLIIAKTKTEVEDRSRALTPLLEEVERNISKTGPYFSGDAFHMVDAAFAPIFSRFDILKRLTGVDLLDKLPALVNWSNSLLKKESIKHSTVESFDNVFVDYFKPRSSYLLRHQ